MSGLRRTARSLCMALLVVNILTVGCGNYISSPEVEQDPNQATEVSADLLLNSIQIAGFAAQEGHLARTTAIWMQQMAGTGFQYLPLGQYVQTEAHFTREMNAIYLGSGLIDIRRIIAENQEKGNREYAGIAKVWEALTVGTAASLWGDLPYSEAVSDVKTPKLDRQEDIYSAMQTLLDDAIRDLESGTGGYVPPNDFVYNGDIGNWIRAAHSLKARFYMHWAETNAANYLEALEHAQMGILSPHGNFTTHHSQAELESNTRYQFQQGFRAGYQRAGRFMIDLLEVRNDPRLEIYYSRDAAGGFSGADPGETKLNVSNLSSGFLAKDASGDILTWEETRLIIAECLFKTGDEAGALTELDTVRRGQETRWGLAPESLDGASGLKGEALIDAIMEEKYIALFLNIEVWNDWKRTNRPGFATASRIPRRMLYSATERNTNPNIPAPSAQPSRNANDPGDIY